MFISDEDALEFLEIYDLTEARARLLVELGRHRDAAKIYAKNGDMLKAVETLRASPPSRDWDNARQMIEYLFMGLRPGFTFGVSPSSSSSSILKLLEFADRLDRSSMTKRDVDEVGPSYPWSAGFSTQCPRSLCFRQSNHPTASRSVLSPGLLPSQRITPLLCYA